MPKRWSKKWRRNYRKYYDSIRDAALKYDIDPTIAFTTALLETGNQRNPEEYGRGTRSGKGIFSMTSRAMKTVGMEGADPYDMDTNIEAGVRYLSYLRNQGVPMDDLPIAFRTGRTGYERYKRGTLDSKTASDVKIRERDIPKVDRFLASAVYDVTPIANIRPGRKPLAPPYDSGEEVSINELLFPIHRGLDD